MLSFIINILIWTIVYTLTRVGLNSKSIQEFFENLKNIELNQVLTCALGGVAFLSIYLFLGSATLGFILGIIASVIVIMVLERCI